MWSRPIQKYEMDLGNLVYGVIGGVESESAIKIDLFSRADIRYISQIWY